MAAVNEQRIRISLEGKLVEALGEDEAALLMNYLPPVGWADVATKRDLEVLAIELRAEMSSLRAEIAEQFREQMTRMVMFTVPTVLTGIGLAVAATHL